MFRKYVPTNLNCSYTIAVQENLTQKFCQLKKSRPIFTINYNLFGATSVLINWISENEGFSDV